MKALIIVDVQNDFLPGGSLAVENGDLIIPVLNDLAKQLPVVVATQDWHPPGHLSFASSHSDKEPFDTIELNDQEQTLWPDHCVWSTSGAAFPAELNLNHAQLILRKGMDPQVDSYSAFYDNDRNRHTGLAEWLRAMNVDHVFIGGLAAEVCVAFTARDAAKLGFEVTIVEDATRTLDSDAFAQTVEKLRKLGIGVKPSPELIGSGAADG